MNVRTSGLEDRPGPPFQQCLSPDQTRDKPQQLYHCLPLHLLDYDLLMVWSREDLVVVPVRNVNLCCKANVRDATYRLHL